MAMFQTLSDGIHSALKSLRGKGKLTESNMRDGLKIVEQSLLDADVNYDVIQTFMQGVTDKAMGGNVLLALDPTQQLIGIFRDELIQLLGPVDPSLHLRRDVNVLMLCGLQGSGKTTTCGKLAKLIQSQGARPLLVAADLQRPAAIDQLHVLGEQLGVPVHSQRGSTDPVQVCQDGVRKAKAENANVVILDTAGRLAIDTELMEELERLDKRVQPDQVYLVIDGMTGQDAVKSATAFNDALELDGVIMTKLDGDARGGALLSVKQVTGVPIKFIGTGERLESLEPFRPEGMAHRILGLGDIVGMVDMARQVVDEQEQKRLEEKLREGEFSLDDFKNMLQRIAAPGLIGKMLDMIPGVAQMKEMLQGEDTEGDVTRLIGIINSMTVSERRNPKVIDSSRRNRIARGSGVASSQVNDLLRQFDMMAPVMKSMAGKGMRGRMQAIQDLQRSGLLDPGSRGPRTKQSTGKRLTPKERAKIKKQREKDLRKRRRGARDQGGETEVE